MVALREMMSVELMVEMWEGKMASKMAVMKVGQ